MTSHTRRASHSSQYSIIRKHLSMSISAMNSQKRSTSGWKKLRFCQKR